MEEFRKSDIREIIEAFASSVVTILFIMIFVVQSFLVRGSSMEPTLLDGERLFVDKITYRFRPPQRGDIVVFKFPKDPTKKFIKRVIAVEGETIVVENGRVIVDGRSLNEPYIKERTNSGISSSIVPQGTFFAMGDNRNYSKDSRDPEVGFISMRNLVGRAFFVYYSPSKYWRSLGQSLQRIRWLKSPTYQPTKDDYDQEPDTGSMYERNYYPSFY
ncbi:MAG TPA: signal peptidase I [Bacillota bacterium]|nr:signal peptidase I [Bacillota bacterium]HPT67426.1 signal peptidase I [Bacillota bacterium]